MSAQALTLLGQQIAAIRRYPLSGANRALLLDLLLEGPLGELEDVRAELRANEPVELRRLRDAQTHRCKLRRRAQSALHRYTEEHPTLAALLRLMRAQEAARGARIHARRAEAAWLQARPA